MRRGVRALGLDPGTKRIGVAVSDIGGSVASPLCVIAEPTRQRAIAEIVRLVEVEEVEAVVVGWPLHMDGSQGPSARAAARLAADLTRLVTVPVELHDERRTSAQAERDMMDAGLNGRQRRQVVDKIAAAIMLQSWLEARRAPSELADRGVGER